MIGIDRVLHLRHRLGREHGQVLPLFAVSLVALIGMSSFAIDIGHLLRVQRSLQASSDAAALAGAHDLPNSTAVATANLYSAVAGKKNARANLSGVTMVSGYPQLKCLTSTGIACEAPANANAVVVKQRVTITPFFARVLGFNSFTITTTSTASARGGIPKPLNAIVVLDTTASMDSSCSASVPGVTYPTRLDCAKAGVRALLTAMWPCPQSMSNCGAVTSGNVANPVDKIGLMVFPGLTSSSNTWRELDCTGNVSSSNLASYGSSPVYSIVPMSSDYRTSATAGLNGANSNLVKAVGWADGNTCGSSSYGAESPGGKGTYYAEVISAAQASLVANARPNAQNVIIFLSDGDASADAPSDISTSLSTDQCQRGVNAAQAATAAGTWVYSIAYGAASSGGCSTDTPAITPALAMQRIASTAARFYNQPSAGDLTTVFKKVANDLTTTRLLPDSTP